MLISKPPYLQALAKPKRETISHNSLLEALTFKATRITQSERRVFPAPTVHQPASTSLPGPSQCYKSSRFEALSSLSLPYAYAATEMFENSELCKLCKYYRQIKILVRVRNNCLKCFSNFCSPTI